MKFRFAQEARSEFTEATRWYAREAGVGQAKAFRNEILRVIRLLIDHPDLGTPTVSPCRRMTAHRFPYDLVYHHDQDAITIVALAHQSRRPEYWAGRRLARAYSPITPPLGEYTVSKTALRGLGISIGALDSTSRKSVLSRPAGNPPGPAWSK